MNDLLVAFLRADLVGRWQWLTSGQLLDAIEFGQFILGWIASRP